jgi:hypothetical protein
MTVAALAWTGRIPHAHMTAHPAAARMDVIGFGMAASYHTAHQENLKKT